MKRLTCLIGLSLIFLVTGNYQLSAQGRVLRRLQQEIEKKATEEILNKKEEEKETQPGEGDRRENARNRGGGGLVQTAPDVNLAISDASRWYSSGDYKSSKTSIREAIWGVELEMGQNVLKSLPEKVQALNVLAGSDKVSSSGIGFVGMLIERVYAGGDEQEFTVSIGNDAAILGIAHMMAWGDMYRESTDQPNQKQIRFQDQRAIIEYDDYSGYSLTVPFGQSSILVMKGVNFNSEADFMAAANQINLNVIKQKLGEQ